MSVKAVREIAAEVASSESEDRDFQSLEEKIFRTIELLKSAREAKATAERDAARLRGHLEQQESEIERMRGELIALRREREEVRTRVEKMLRQIEALTTGESGR